MPLGSSPRSVAVVMRGFQRGNCGHDDPCYERARHIDAQPSTLAGSSIQARSISYGHHGCHDGMATLGTMTLLLVDVRGSKGERGCNGD